MSENQQKKMYQRWWVWVIGPILLLLLWVVGSNTIKSAVDKATTKDIPNVMSINYTDAEKVLAEKGFQVTSVETDAEPILSENSFYNHSVKKGDVFKMNDELNPNYSYKTTKDKAITIYYAKDDYPPASPEPKEEAATAADAAPKEQAKATSAAAAPKSNGTAASSGSSDWRQFLKDYEAWMDKYVAFMKKYPENPTAFASEYAKFLKETAEWTEKSNQYQDTLKDMSAADLAEYMEAIGRILKKMQ